MPWASQRGALGLSARRILGEVWSRSKSERGAAWLYGATVTETQRGSIRPFRCKWSRPDGRSVGVARCLLGRQTQLLHVSRRAPRAADVRRAGAEALGR